VINKSGFVGESVIAITTTDLVSRQAGRASKVAAFSGDVQTEIQLGGLK
jgi:hypothetical protein